MLKQALEEWTRSLTDADRACALTALAALGFRAGIGDASPLVELLDPPARPSGDGPWHFTGLYAKGAVRPAWELARAWRLSEPQRPRPVRVGVPLAREPLGTGIVEWLHAELRNPATGVAGVYFEVDDLAPQRSPWRWPLRVGVPDGAEGDALVADIRGRLHSDWETLFRFERPSAGEEKHDILLLPRVDALLDPHRTRATMVLACGALPVVGWPSLAKRVGASAVSLVEHGLESCFVRLLVELSQDHPVDVALARAAKDRGLPVPILLARTSFVMASRLDEVRERLLARLMVTKDTPRRGLEGLGAPRRTRGINRRWDVAESDPTYRDATAMAQILAEVERELARTRASRPRHLHARVFATGGGPGDWPPSRAADARLDELRQARRFVRDRWHLLAIHVGPARRDTLQTEEPLAEEGLKFKSGCETLQVVVAAPGCSLSASLPYQPLSVWFDEQLATAPRDRAAATGVELPEVGDSSLAWFALRPECDQVEARILVVHENRVLQTALLGGPVDAAENSAEAAGDGSIALRAEADVYNGLESLYARRAFDAAIVVNHGEDGEARMTTVVGDRAELRELGNAKAAFDAISGQLGRLTEDPESFAGPAAEALRTLLVDLANHGVALRRAVVEDTQLKELAGGGRLQIIAAKPEAFLPLELLYDGDAPLDDAALCPQHAAALVAGSCAGCPDREHDQVVCPVRFWGLSKVIERHAFKPRQAGDAEFTVITPTPTQHQFPAPASAVFAYSARAALTDVAKVALADVSTRLRDLTRQACEPIDTWSDWRAAVLEREPSVLVLVPHTKRQAGVAALEIGTEQFLRAPQIKADVVGSHEPTLAILFGCSTADPTIAFASFPSNLRHAGVEITIGTLSPVLGRHAAPAMRELLTFLADAWKQSRATPLAELVARFRRDQMSRGQPFGLTVVAYGDADWTFGG